MKVSRTVLQTSSYGQPYGLSLTVWSFCWYLILQAGSTLSVGTEHICGIKDDS
ncbi:MAG: hypothetical protein QM487_01660 [Candidatus Marithrix sp.]